MRTHTLCAVGARGKSRRHLRWPLPALLAWLLAWALFALLRRAGLAPGWAWLAAALLGALLATGVAGHWRQALVVVGFPLSALALGASAPAWSWALAALPPLLAYPLRAWSDAPFFPTPAAALQALPQALVLPAGARVLDAGCGLGHGLRALRRAWPQVRLHGIEWSLPLFALCRWRCRFAHMHRGDMWVHDWSGYDAVYVFQRPESMARAWDKALAELRPGAWLLSLEFAVPGVTPALQLAAGGARRVWCYRLPTPAGSTLAPKCR